MLGEMTEKIDKLDFWQDVVEEIIVKNNKAIGVKTIMGVTINSKADILNSGTFWNGSFCLGKRYLGER